MTPTDSENKIKFLQTLESSLSPFEKFVAKSDIEEQLPLVKDRQTILRQIINALSFSTPEQIIPIIGDTGMGKTFILWQIKKSMEIQTRATFLEVPANAKMFYYNLYTKIIEVIGANILRDISNKLVDEWGGKTRKYGLFLTSNTQKIFNQAIQQPFFQRSKHREQLQDCIKILILHAMDPEKNQTAERWLLGEIMDADELFYLGVENNLSAEYMAEELLNLIINNIEDGIILMFDDLDKNWKRFSAEDDIDSQDDDDWTVTINDDEQNNEETVEKKEEFSSSNGNIAIGKTIFHYLATLIETNPKVKIVFTIHKDSKAIIEQFPRITQDLIHEPIYLSSYSIDGSIQYYLDAIQKYREKHHIPIISGNNFYPLTKELIVKIHDYSKGNPRELIRSIQKLFDAIIFDLIPVEELGTKFEKLVKQ